MNPPRIRRLATTPSTNDDARLAAETGEAEGLVIHALEQTAGRGRHGRTWQSPEGNLYCSILLRPPDGLPSFGFYSFAAALALHDAVKTFVPQAQVSLKWPNDVLVDGKKISGILLESGDGWLITGMGLNVMHHPPEGLYPSTSLHASGAVITGSDEVIDTLLQRFWHWSVILRKDGFEPVRAAWLVAAQKQRMSVKLPGGVIEGDFLDIDAQGHLRLKLSDGSEKSISTGDVFFAA